MRSQSEPTGSAILKVTRIFGECELAAPPDYIKEVSRFIAMWRSTSRYEAALKRAREGGYMQRIVTSFAARNLPPQCFYLALQESNFVTNAVGSPTRWGIARGMWQFIPETGRRCGLIIAGNQDEQLDWERATTAAARSSRTSMPPTPRRQGFWSWLPTTGASTGSSTS